MKNKFFQVCAGISMVLLASGFFIRSVSPAKAAPQVSSYTTGKYGMVTYGNYILVWNTATGESKYYAGFPPRYNPLGE